MGSYKTCYMRQPPETQWSRDLCPMCGKKFTPHEDLQLHLVAKPPNGKPSEVIAWIGGLLSLCMIETNPNPNKRII